MKEGLDGGGPMSLWGIILIILVIAVILFVFGRGRLR